MPQMDDPQGPPQQNPDGPEAQEETSTRNKAVMIGLAALAAGLGIAFGVVVANPDTEKVTSLRTVTKTSTKQPTTTTSVITTSTNVTTTTTTTDKTVTETTTRPPSTTTVTTTNGDGQKQQ